ncbi:inactive pancreatic lipase-related protein 1 [Acyrthosiphon pisum]|uniref:Lipase domain-containing protein n=1 Tax=Acyrthosiphon pisum TaxID=7029 RepID=A0A8R2JPB4_ACYPI|nr:inactive pancreatic lipase-related protein 1 [Acyrthosiphon pisum]|eukprot:XP_001947773.1 PREDICTED: inactive pancreatic lipase-related protein 1 [Acyrthosiphon pisum]
MLFKFQFLSIGILIFLNTLNNCNGQLPDNTVTKITGVVKNAVTGVQDSTTLIVHNVKDICEKIGDCVKQSGTKVVNKTVTITKESLQNGATVVNKTITTTKETLKKIPLKSIEEIIKKAKCVIPKNADNILRAALLQQCISPSLGFGNESRCFDELGCFSMEHPWSSNLRPFPQPMKPEEVEVKIYSYTRKQNARYTVQLWPNILLEGSDFDPNRPFTVFIVHGFNSDGENQWMSGLKDAYLKQRDANIFLVDWGKGSKQFNYLQVASNTRIVGAELIRFGKYLVDHYQLDPLKIHVMGHSLGAHISSYFGKGIPGLSRITAFDPAQPGFEGCPKEVRLDKSDAHFVDVIHTSCRPTVPFLGFGLITPVGHVDIYMNGGFIQPGCTVPPINEVKLTSISDLAAIPADVLGTWVACSHGRSFSYFIESLADNCTFWAQKIKLFSAITNAATVGQLTPILMNIDKCKFNECVPLGLNTDQYPGRGVFIAGTAFFEPYCKSNLETDRLMRKAFKMMK